MQWVQEMKKYLRALFWGSTKTKINLWTIVGILVAEIIIIIFTVLMSSGMMAFLACMMGIFFIMYTQSLSFQEIEKELAKKNEWKDFEKSKEEKEKIKENYFNQYGEKELQRLFHAYKVKKESRAILIDSSIKYKINQCPAYIWKDKTYFHMLLLEKEPRKVQIELNKIPCMEYEKGAVVSREGEYTLLKKAPLVQLVFKDFLPTYYSGNKSNMDVMLKNLYILGADIKVTNKSARSVFDILNLTFQLNSKQADAERFGGYFVDAYKLNILWKDGVLEVEEYKQKMKHLLRNLAHNEINLDSFRRIIKQLIQYRLITDDYAEFFIEYRNKLEEKKKKEGT